MATIAINIPGEFAEALAEAEPLIADEVELMSLIAYNVRERGLEVAEWAEKGADRDPEQAGRLVRLLDALTRAYAALGSAPGRSDALGRSAAGAVPAR